MQVLTLTFAVPDGLDAADARLLVIAGTGEEIERLGGCLLSILDFANGQARALDTLRKGLAAFPGLVTQLTALHGDAVAAAQLMDGVCVRVGNSPIIIPSDIRVEAQVLQ